MTPKQSLVAHLQAEHWFYVKVTHAKLIQRHTDDHAAKRLTHTHKGADAWRTGSDLIEVMVSLSPPKNPGANRPGDRNWVLSVATKASGQRFELAGTHANDPGGAQDAADKALGYQANWVPQGWGFRHQDNVKERANG